MAKVQGGETFLHVGFGQPAFFKPEVLHVNHPTPVLFLPRIFSISPAKSCVTWETNTMDLHLGLSMTAPAFKESLQLKRLLLFYFCFGPVLSPLTTK